MLDVEIIEFEDRYAKDFASINYQWLHEHFEIEQPDIYQLENPFDSIIKPGGMIFFAKIGDTIVGTVGLQIHGDSFELVKMGVKPEFRGQKIGEKLIASTINYARKMNKRSILLESSTKLKSAVQLYQNMGFRETVPNLSSPYSRCNVWMELKLAD